MSQTFNRPLIHINQAPKISQNTQILPISSPKIAPISTGISSQGAVGVSKKKKEDTPWWKSVINVVDKINIPQYAMIGAIEWATGKGDKRGLMDNISDQIQKREGFAPLLRKYGAGNKTAAVVGFAADLILDPLNLVGAGAIAKGIKGGAKLVGKTVDFAKTAEDVSKLSGIQKFLAKSAAKAEERAIAKANIRFGKIGMIDTVSEATVPNILSGLEKTVKQLSKSDDVTELTKKIKDARLQFEALKKTGKAISDEKAFELISDATVSIRDVIVKGEKRNTELMDLFRARKTKEQITEKFGTGKVGEAIWKIYDWTKYSPGASVKVAKEAVEQRKVLEDRHLSKLAELELSISRRQQELSNSNLPLIGDNVTESLKKEKVKELQRFADEVAPIDKILRGESQNIKWLSDWMQGRLGDEWLDSLWRKNAESFNWVSKEKFSPLELTRALATRPEEVLSTAKLKYGKGTKDLMQYVGKTFIKRQKSNLKEIGDYTIVDPLTGDLVNMSTKGFKPLAETKGEKFVSTEAGRKTLRMINTLGKSYAKVLSLFKQGKTTLNPGAHPRNIATNLIFTSWDPRAGSLSDPKWWHALSDATRIAFRGPKAEPGTELYDLYNKFNSYFDIAGGSTSVARDAMITADGVNLIQKGEYKPIKGVLDKIKHAYGNEDNIFKIAHVLFRTDPKYSYNAGTLGRLRGGQNVSQIDDVDAIVKAVAEANDIYLNYAAMPKLAQFLRDIPFGAPFISFMYGFTNKFAKQFVESPGRINWPVKFQRAVQEVDPLTETERKTIEERGFFTSPRYGKLPFFKKIDPLTGKHSVNIFDYFGYFPQYSFSKYNEDGVDIPLLDNPVVSIPISLIKNENFLGQKIFEGKMTDEQKAKATTKYISEQLLPTMFPTVNQEFGIGGYFWRRLKEEGEKPYGSRVRRIMQQFGFPTQELFYWEKAEKKGPKTPDKPKIQKSKPAKPSGL